MENNSSTDDLVFNPIDFFSNNPALPLNGRKLEGSLNFRVVL